MSSSDSTTLLGAAAAGACAAILSAKILQPPTPTTAASPSVQAQPAAGGGGGAGGDRGSGLGIHTTQEDQTDPVTVCVSGAAGQIGYSLIPLLCSGAVFGETTPVYLRLLDVKQGMEAMRGIAMELEDASYPLLRDVYTTCDYSVAFTGVDVVVLVGGMPRREGMERSDLIGINSKIFHGMGVVLNEVADPSVKVLVVANPANTNCRTLIKSCPKIPATNFSALTRLDHNRAKSLTARRVNWTTRLQTGAGGRAEGVVTDTNRVAPNDVKNVIIWGNHSQVQYPDLNHAVVMLRSHRPAPVRSMLDTEWIEGEFVTTVQQRGAKVIQARGASSALSAAAAIAGHLNDWLHGTQEGEFVSMAIDSTGNPYGVPDGLVFSFPVICSGGEYSIVEDLYIDPRSRDMIEKNVADLAVEWNAAQAALNAKL